MSDQKKQIDGQSATLFRDGENPVYLLPDGKFTTQWLGKWLKRTSLIALDNATNKGRPALKLMRYSTGSVFHSCDSEVQEISEWLDSKLVNREGKRVYKGWGGWWLFDAEIQDALMDLEKRRAAFEKTMNEEFSKITKTMNEEFSKITKKAKRVDGSNFKDLLKTKGTT